MRSHLNHLEISAPQHVLSRRGFLSSLGALTLAPRLFGSEPASDAIPVTAINHVMIHVTDLERSLDWYQKLFGMSVVARQGERHSAGRQRAQFLGWPAGPTPRPE